MNSNLFIGNWNGRIFVVSGFWLEPPSTNIDIMVLLKVNHLQIRVSSHAYTHSNVFWFVHAFGPFGVSKKFVGHPQI